MDTSSLPEPVESTTSEAAPPISSSPTPETPVHSIVPVADPSDPQPADAPPTRVTATAVSPQPSAAPPTALPQSIGLQDRQRIALQALATGKDIDTAAQLAGVHPASIYRWKKHDARFIAALNAWRAESRRAAQDTLQAAVSHAAQNVLRAAQAGDVRTSLTLLKSLGTLAPQRPGSSLVPVVAKELATEAGLIRQTVNPRPKKVSLHLLEAIFNNMDMPEDARVAYREGFARHRASLKPTPAAPLTRPVTPEGLEQAAIAMQPTPGRAFKYVAEPSLSEYKKYQDELSKREQAASADEPAAVPLYLRPLPPKPVLPPPNCRIIVTAVAPENQAKVIAQIKEVESYCWKGVSALPHAIRHLISSKYAEEYARHLESLGATVEIRPTYEDGEG